MRHSLLPAALLPVLLAACGGGGSPTTPPPGTGQGSALTTRLGACAVVNQSADPAASSCLTGAYTGKTLSGAECSLTVRADGGYDYVSPTLTYTFTATAQATRVFGHNSIEGSHQVIWLINDPMTANEPKELNFEARWGANIAAPKLEIEAMKHLNGGGSVSSTCNVPL
ncbi:hypothetical protein [Deinococcus sonorensis]|uniref:Lipoprotein n=2 Tax=Deinococcus sonorensis TaxID=309891 RepID=A0AAU7UEY9_9DEIO